MYTLADEIEMILIMIDKHTMLSADNKLAYSEIPMAWCAFLLELISCSKLLLTRQVIMHAFDCSLCFCCHSHQN